jgi:V-type H+-transporting ATPase subunit C
MVYRIVVLRENMPRYISDARKAGLNVKHFTYNYDLYKEELAQKTKLEEKVALLTETLYKKGLFAFSELFIALMHLKVMRAFIDGVLRFGIPARFALSIVHPNKG